MKWLMKKFTQWIHLLQSELFNTSESWKIMLEVNFYTQLTLYRLAYPVSHV